MRITRDELDKMFARAVHAASHAGVENTQNWQLQIGSVTYGRAYRVYDVATGGTQSDFLGSSGFLGSNAREAYQALHAMARALELVLRAQNVAVNS